MEKWFFSAMTFLTVLILAMVSFKAGAVMGIAWTEGPQFWKGAVSVFLLACAAYTWVFILNTLHNPLCSRQQQRAVMAAGIAGSLGAMAFMLWHGDLQGPNYYYGLWELLPVAYLFGLPTWGFVLYVLPRLRSQRTQELTPHSS